jgi:hypothetical protein
MVSYPQPAAFRSKSLVEAVCLAQPYHVLLIGLLPGFALIFGSLVLHIAAWTARAPDFADRSREVGYLPALNWSLTYAILFPILLYLMANTVSGLANALDRLHIRGMVQKIDSEALNDPLVPVDLANVKLQPERSRILTSSWLSGSRSRKRFLIAFAVIIPAAFGATEWFLNNLLRLIHISPVPSHSDYDWGLAGLMPLHPGAPEWTLVHRLANALFDLLAFTTEVFLIGSLIAFFITVLDLGRVVPTGRRGETHLLLPDLKSPDRRLGFEVFSDPLGSLLGVALVAYLICYLVRLQGAYMANTTSSNLADFVSDYILAGVRQAAKSPTPTHLVDAFIALFNLGDQQIRGALAWMMSVLVAVFSLSTVVMTVQGAAASAQRTATDRLKNSNLDLAGQNPHSAANKLKSMAIWPLGYLKLNLLLFWIFLAVLTLILYRIGLFVAGIVSFTLFLRMMKRLLLPSRKDEASTSPADNLAGGDSDGRTLTAADARDPHST